jgi:hypothetical protein
MSSDNRRVTDGGTAGPDGTRTGGSLWGGSSDVRDLGGLCVVCIHAKVNERLVRYPVLPVLECPGFEASDLTERGS